MASALIQRISRGLRSCDLRLACALVLLLPAASLVLVAAGAEEQAANDKKTSRNGVLPSPAKDQAGAEAKAEVLLMGRLSREMASGDESVRFWLTIENQSDVALQNVALEHLDMDGFRLVRRCWSADSTNQACVAKGEAFPTLPAACRPNGDNLCAELAPRQAITIWGDLQRDHAAPKVEAFAVLRWSRSNLTSQSTVALGSVESLSWFRGFWLAVTERWQLGIPFWVGVFTGIYAIAKSRREKRDHVKEVLREEQAKREEVARQVREKKEAQELDQRAKTWNLLLSEVQRLALDHYMPIASTAQGVIQYFGFLADPVKRTADNYAAAFCYLIRFHWRLRVMKRKGASWYFKNLTAEEIVVGLFQAHRVLLGLDDPARQSVLDGLLDEITEAATLATMMAGMANYTVPQQAFFADFKTWVVTNASEEDIAVLSAMTKVIGFETNRPLLYWYEERRALPLEPQEKDAIQGLIAAQTSAGGPFPAQVSAYLAEAMQAVKLN